MIHVGEFLSHSVKITLFFDSFNAFMEPEYTFQFPGIYSRIPRVPERYMETGPVPCGGYFPEEPSAEVSAAAVVSWLFKM